MRQRLMTASDQGALQNRYNNDQQIIIPDVVVMESVLGGLVGKHELTICRITNS